MSAKIFFKFKFFVFVSFVPSIIFFLFSSSWSKLTPALEIIDFLKFKFFCKKKFIVGKEKKEKIITKDISEKWKKIFCFFWGLRVFNFFFLPLF